MRPQRLLICGLFFCCSAFGADRILPDPKFTPGVILKVPIQQLCTIGYANKINGGVRNLSESEKRQAWISYHPGQPFQTKGIEYDHLVSLELGGSNDIRNIWPQSYSGQWNARVKDKLEDWMAAQVRHALKINGPQAASSLLATYQKEIAQDWVGSFKKHLGQPLTPSSK